MQSTRNLTWPSAGGVWRHCLLTAGPYGDVTVPWPTYSRPPVFQKGSFIQWS